MCGITGFIGHHDRSLLVRMNRALRHRGPDEEGYRFTPPVALAMRRLSIIDVQSGHQPMANEKHTVWTVFNGEIYNFRELRLDLAKKGHHFRTDHSDTETIVHAYEEYGPEFVTKLNGMFAIAVWDDAKDELHLYRDRVGEKPLYFWQFKNDFFFASEIKSFLTVPFFKKKLNPRALFYYLSLKHAPRSECFFEGVESLAPGEHLVRDRNGRIKRSLYWEIDASHELKISELEAAEEIQRLLKSSVQYRMISDVPLGAYLSGGVDSSAVVGIMSRFRKKALDTFSLTYRDGLSNKEMDRASAFQMAKRYRTVHREYKLGVQEFWDDLDNVIGGFDEPFGGTVSTFFLSKLIRKHVKVAISGDGADELFGSYRIHRLAYPLARLNDLTGGKGDISRLNSNQRRDIEAYGFPLDYLARFRGKDPANWHSKLSVFSENEKMKLLSKNVRSKTSGCSTLGYYKEVYSRSRSHDVLNRVLQVECQNLLPDQVLCFVDRLSMAHSVEVRPPFLDPRLVEFAFKLPGSMKIKHGVTKCILKRALRGILPQSIIRRPKEGFILPYHYWMKEYLHDKISRILCAERLKKHGLFNIAYVESLLEDANFESLGHANKVYLLLMFQLWWEKYWE